MSKEKFFIDFIMENSLDEKHNTSQVFKYDYEKNETDWDNLEETKMFRDNFYIDGVDLYRAFMAGIKYGEKNG